MVFAGFYATLYAEYRFHVEDVKDTLYSVYSGPSPRQEGRLIVAICPVGLAVHHHAVRGGTFVLKCSGTCQTTRVIAGKTHSQSPILKCYGGTQQPGHSYETMTKLHPPHSNWTCQKEIISNLDHFNAWSAGACEVPWALAGSDAYIVHSCEPLDVPIRSIQH